METVFASIADPASGQGHAAGVCATEFEYIVRSHQRRIFRLLYGLVRDRDIADTLTQECFLRAYQKRNSFRGEARIETWLTRIAVNLARDHARNRRLAFWRKLVSKGRVEENEPQVPEAPDPAPSPERVLLAREQLEFVWSVMDHLPPQQRSVFLLRFAEEMTLDEIARVLELEVGTVKAHLFRAVSRVRKRLREQATP